MSARDEVSAPSSDWPIFVISLKDAASRRATISQQLCDCGLNFEFIDAIDGRAGMPPEHEGDIDRPGTETYFGRPLSDGEYACALSHLAVYRRILADRLPGAIILEDDAILGDGFAVFLKERGYDHAPLIQLDHLNARVPRFGATTIQIGSCTLWPLTQNALLGSGYSISAAGAAFMLENALPLRGPADWPCDLRALGPFCAIPKLVSQPEGEADISTLRDERDVMRSRRRRAESGPAKYLSSKYWRKRWMRLATKRMS